MKQPKRSMNKALFGTQGRRQTIRLLMCSLASHAKSCRETRTAADDDRHLLKHFSHSTRLFQHWLVSMDVPDKAAIAQLDREVAIRATELTYCTPSPRQVRVVGHLDMIRHSTRSFEMLLQQGNPCAEC